jgi:predicted membrane protein
MEPYKCEYVQPAPSFHCFLLGSSDFSKLICASIVIIFLLHFILLLGPRFIEEVTIIVSVIGFEHEVSKLEDDDVLKAPEHVDKEGNYLKSQVLGASWLVVLASLI